MHLNLEIAIVYESEFALCPNVYTYFKILQVSNTGFETHDLCDTGALSHGFESRSGLNFFQA